MAAVDRGKYAFEIRGSQLLVSCGQLPATGLEPLFTTAKTFAGHIPQPVRVSFGTSQPVTHDSRSPG